jgi:elongation factor P--(R)-beta-lysine ligase
MTDWRPSSDAAAARRRAAMLDRARHYFASEGVLAVDTPALGEFATTDPHIASLSAHSEWFGDYFLHTSPEARMKRLLAAGYPDIYSICRVYRDGESGKRHAPEFTMLEWYRRGFDLDAIVADTIRLIAHCLDDAEIAARVEVVEFGAAVERVTGLDAFSAGVDALADCVAADARLRHEIGDERDAWLDLIMSTLVVPRLTADALTVIRHYPASQAAMARLNPVDPALAERFEVFFGELELANGYVELTDADEQRQRFDRDLDRRQRLGCAAVPWDRSLYAALGAGLPDCAGVAVGIERLQMVLDGSDDIRDVMTFAFETGDG